MKRGLPAAERYTILGAANYLIRSAIVYYKTWEDLQKVCPIVDGTWDKERLYEYLLQSCYQFSKQIGLFVMGLPQLSLMMTEQLWYYLASQKTATSALRELIML